MTGLPAAAPLADLDAAPWPRFSDAEYARRHAAVDTLRAGSGCDALVVFGGGSARHELQYLAAWPARQEGWLVLTPGDEPVLFVQLYNHVPNAAEMTVGARVAWAGASSAETVAAELRRRGARRVGLVGAISYQHHGRLAAALGEGGEIVDLTPAFRRMRLVKSDEEIAWTRRGAALCDLALRTLVAEARPGMREYELGALTEHAYGRVGGQHGICFIATGPMTGGGAYVPRQNWSSRVVDDGDAILIELSAGIGGYTGQVLRTIAVGDAPVPAPCRDLHDAAEAAYAAITGLIRPARRPPSSWPPPASSRRPASPCATTSCTGTAAATSRPCSVRRGRRTGRRPRWSCGPG